jgi:CRP-like cAMP-binding protein
MRLITRRRAVARVPPELARALRFGTDRPRFGVTPLGTSHGFDPEGDVTSFVVWISGRGILVDPSPEALLYLEQMGVAPLDVPYVILTHVHADHDGGLVEKLLSGHRTTVIASDVVFRCLAEKVELVTGHHIGREELALHVPANPGAPIALEIGGEAVTLETRWNLHPIPTNGFRLSVGGKVFGYAGDTQYDPELIADLYARGQLTREQRDDLLHFFWDAAGTPSVDLLYHEAGIPPIHTDRATLAALPDVVRARTFLVHIADPDVPSGFSPAKPTLFGTQVLLPSTAAARHRVLLEDLRLVSYLYDVPASTLEALIGGAAVREYATEEVIVRQGPVARGESLNFYVIVDGGAEVRDGRRLVASLGKGDSFGEWGISHQRGFRVADVVAVRDCQCLELTDAHYRWLVGRHPVIQERIGRIRSLLPRLQAAQARAWHRSAADPSTRVSVISTMSVSQLSSFALFSTVAAFKEGQPIVLEGAPADGFYVLLSGHLAATTGGRLIAELSEGDIFGEIGLLEGGRRGATVSVVSADAEVLFMSAQNFRDLLQAVPAFALEIRETAARRETTAAR